MKALFRRNAWFQAEVGCRTGYGLIRFSFPTKPVVLDETQNRWPVSVWLM